MVKIMLAFEKGVAIALCVILSVIIVLSTIHWGSVVVGEIIVHPYHLIDIHKLLELLGTLIMIVIAIELLATMRIFFDKTAVKIEAVYLLAMMALAREVIILDLHKTPSTTLLGVAAIIAALSAGYFLIKGRSKPENEITLPKVTKEDKKKSN